MVSNLKDNKLLNKDLFSEKDFITKYTFASISDIGGVLAQSVKNFVKIKILSTREESRCHI